MFKEKFREAHMPSSIMALKRKEFMSLEQGNMSVTTYVHEFNRLSRYAPDDVATDVKRQQKFMEGLHPFLLMQLRLIRAPSLWRTITAGCKKIERESLSQSSDNISKINHGVWYMFRGVNLVEQPQAQLVEHQYTNKNL